MRRRALVVFLAVILLADTWLWLRLDTAAERIISGSLLSVLIAFWYQVFSQQSDDALPRK